MSRTALAMAAAAALLTTLIEPASAESRLFSARADKEGVTITELAPGVFVPDSSALMNALGFSENSCFAPG